MASTSRDYTMRINGPDRDRAEIFYHFSVALQHPDADVDHDEVMRVAEDVLEDGERIVWLVEEETGRVFVGAPA